MCGLLGIAGDISSNDVTIFDNLLVLSSLRGRDSTGVCRVPRGNQEIVFLKDVGDPLHLQENKNYGKVSNHPSRALIGHTRSATIGKVNRDNAQPFVKDPLVGTHNGTISTKYLTNLFKKNNQRDDTGTDSEMIYESMKFFGVSETLKNLSGALALVWYNSDNETINFARNYERELWFTFSEDGRKLLWASEPYFLKLACDRSLLYASKLKIEEPKLLPIGKWYSWKVPRKWSEAFGEARIEAFADIPRPVIVRENYTKVFHNDGTVSTYDSESEWEKWLHENDNKSQKIIPLYGGKNGPRTEEEEKTIKARYDLMVTAAAKLKKDKIVRAGKKAKWFKGWNGNLLDQDEYKRITHHGCAWCTSKAEWIDGGDPEVIRFIDNTDYLCNSCMKDPEILECCNLDLKAG